MPGAFGGGLEPGENEARECQPGALADLIAFDAEAAKAPEGLVPIRGVANEIRYRGDLRGLTPLERGPVPGMLAALAAAAKALAALHATGRVHGDLRPAHIWTSPTRTVLTYVEKPLDAGALLRARMRQGADPREVAFAAPEVVLGAPATAESDVFSLGAILYWAATGRVPHGQIHFDSKAALSARLEQLVLLAVEPDPTARPVLADLVAEVVRAAPAPVANAVAAPVAEAIATAGVAPAAEAAPVLRVRKISPPSERVEAAPPPPEKTPEFESIPALQQAAQERRSTPVILTVLLGLGCLFVLTGALWLVAVGWDTIGEWGRLALLAALTGGIGAGGRALETRGNKRSGLALIVLSSQLLWAIGADLLAVTGSSSQPGPWAFVAAAVSSVGYGLAWRRQSAVLAVLASIGALMALVFTWTALDETGHCVLLSLATVGLAASAFALDRRGHAAAPVVHFVWTQLLWLDGGYYLRAIDHIEDAGPWAVVASVSALGSLWLAVRRKSVFFSMLGTFAACLALILTGAALSTGKPEGLAVWMLVCALTLFALGGGLRATSGGAVGAPPMLAAAPFALLSAIAALATHEKLPAFAVAFPYVVGGLAAAVAFAMRRSRGPSGGALALATLVFVLAPVVHTALETRQAHAYRDHALVLGVLLMVAGLALRKSPAVRASLFLVAIAHIAVERSAGLTATAIALPLVVAALETGMEGVAVLAALAVGAALVLFGPVEGLRTLGEGNGPGLGMEGSKTLVRWAEWTLLSALLEVALALVGRGRGVGSPFAVVGGLFLAASFVASLGTYEHALVFSVAWPYLLGVLAVLGGLACGHLGAEQGRRAAFVLAGLVLAGTPLFHGFRDGPVLETYRWGAPIAGAAALVAGFILLRKPEQASALLVLAVAGVAHVAASRSLAASSGALAFALLGHGVLLRTATLGTLGSVAASVAMAVWAGELHLRHPIEWAEWTALTAVVLGVVAVASHFLGAVEVGAPAATMAALHVLASWLCGLAMLDQKERLADFWPYVLLAALVGVAVAARSGPYRKIVLVPAALIAIVTPTLHALWHWSEPSYLYVATTVGTAAVVAAFRWPPLAEKQGPQLAGILVGLPSIAAAPTVLALLRLADQNGDALILELLDPALGPAERLEHRMFYLPYLVLTAVVLVTLALLFAKDSPRKLPYRILEVSGLAIFFGTLSLLSFIRWAEFLYPAVLAIGGVVALAVGAWGRHVLLVLVPAVALTIQLWFQYWAKLKDRAPMPLLVIGFGIGLLVGAVLFEKRVRPKLKELDEWA